MVVDNGFDWEGDAPLRTPLHRSVIYEAHVRGLTMRHPEVPESLRGTYLGVAHPAILRHLRELGITAIELMPVHSFVDDKLLLDKGLRNYWGYNSIGFFAPDVRYRAGQEIGAEVRQFKEMVKALHRAGIEVILDVVYNHTAEGNHLGPTFNFKGIDNPTYYRLVAGDPRYYFDYTGTGNTLNVRHPQVLALIMDSLRYWAREMHVDGFRFDLASALARQLHEVDQLSSFFTLIHQSPTLSQVKLIAEPWDVGEGGYQVGNFPVRWAEWNGRYRDAIRALWRGDGGKAGEIGYRLTGSSDLYQSSGRSPSASINLITAHDGFTLDDLVSYEHKHNEANGEGNRDGNDDEHSANSGAEGDTDDPAVLALRRRQRRNLLATMLLSQGTPMILGGDEMGRTQRGNNNAYCQDNEISWVDWNLNDEQRALLDFTRRLVRIRHHHPSLHRSKFFQGRSIHGTDLKDLLWLRHDGQAMSAEDWQNPLTQSLSMFLAGRGIDEVDEQGRPIVDDNLLLLLNASNQDLTFTIPRLDAVKEGWQILVDTSDDQAEERVDPGQTTVLVARSLKLFRAPSRVVRAGGALHTLLSTYRVQLCPAFGFEEARGVVDYLSDLGITDFYASPVLAAAPGSSHGYDLVTHDRLSPELGGEAGFFALSRALEEKGMGLLLDWVPNHMGIPAGHNRFWDDVLENGPNSLYAEFFDIDWEPPKADLRDRVLIPILGDQYGEVLERGELKVLWEDGTFRLAYYEHRFPLGPKTLLPLLERVAALAGLPEDSLVQQELGSILSALRHLPERHETAPEARKERAREKEVFKRRLNQLVEQSPEIAGAIESALTELNGTAGVVTSFDALDALLRAQSYRLASWHVASEEINYRRFFDVNQLAAIRMELPAVFDQAHALLFKLLDERLVHALRLDHTDGLYDPLAYFESLQRRYHRPSAPPGAIETPDDAARPLPLLVEKILEPGERLPLDWPVDGTTGYEFASAVLGLWVDPRAEPDLTRLYQRITGDLRSFQEHVYQSKHAILRDSLASEVNMLARSLSRIANEHRKWRDFTLISITRALVEILAAFPVYRTYLREGAKAGEQDERRIRTAVRLARRRSPGLSPTLFQFLEDVLLMRAEGSEEEKRAHARFALRFQQFTGPVTAKAVEDTAFYRYPRLVCLNEVGSMPAQFGTSVEAFHAQNIERARSWPLSMITTSTHDTKRGEDTGARIAAITEFPDAWRRAVTRYGELGARFKVDVDGEPAPSARDEYLFYQTVLGAWPFGWDGERGRAEFVARIRAYLQKAIKEAKEKTSWTNPSAAYEEATARFCEGMLEEPAFMTSMGRFCQMIAPVAATNALSQCLLRLTSPGVSDTYQGSELWNQSLVDPDNRTIVDYAERRARLAAIKQSTLDPRAIAADLLARFEDGDVKLLVTHRALEARRAHRDLFLRGDYRPIGGTENVVAFVRSFGAERAITAVPRLSRAITRGAQPFPTGAVWGDRTLRVPSSGTYRDVLTGATVKITGQLRLAELFADFPVALLLLESSRS
ncbi:MAG: malto-oligosyltrehalose synthase [Minicystis sp.]